MKRPYEEADKMDPAEKKVKTEEVPQYILDEVTRVRACEPSWCQPIASLASEGDDDDSEGDIKDDEEEQITTVLDECEAQGMAYAFDVPLKVMENLHNLDHHGNAFELKENGIDIQKCDTWTAFTAMAYEKPPVYWTFAFLFNRADPENGERFSYEDYGGKAKLFAFYANICSKYKSVYDYVLRVYLVLGLDPKKFAKDEVWQGQIQCVEEALNKYKKQLANPKKKQKKIEKKWVGVKDRHGKDRCPKCGHGSRHEYNGWCFYHRKDGQSETEEE